MRKENTIPTQTEVSSNDSKLEDHKSQSQEDSQQKLLKEIEDLRAGTVADTNGWLVPVVGI